MAKFKPYSLSIVIPVFNEALGVAAFHTSLVHVLDSLDARSYEIIYCDDGSIDTTGDIIRNLSAADTNIRLVSFSRNFGKEYALTAGIRQATGDAIITIDGDGQHPVELIQTFITAWQEGAQVVVGLRKNTTQQNNFKQWRSKSFYVLFNQLTGEHLVPGSTDFRLIDSEVRSAFIKLNESDRITRGLIDWLGFKRTIIEFDARDRQYGTASYGTRQLIRLAVNSFVSLSPIPLYVFGYTGVVITTLSALLGVTVGIEQLLLNDPLGWKFTGTALLAIVLLFLVGIILLSQGMLSLYISHIHTQTKHRPLYVINHSHSVGIDKK